MPALVRELFALTPELSELDDAVHDLEGWEAVEGLAAPADRFAREALERRAQELEAKLAPRVAELGEGLHEWCLRAQAEAEAARAELQRVRHFEVVKRRRLTRVKELALRFLTEAGLQRLQGATWRLRRQANGGRPPIEHDGVTPVPFRYARPVAVDAMTLYGLIMAARPELRGCSDAGIAEQLDLSLQPSIERATTLLDDVGELPIGFTAQPRGEHLRVE